MAPIFTGGRMGFGRVDSVTSTSTSRIWSVNSSTDFASDGVYNIQDISSGQTFYVYTKTINSKKTLCVMAGRQTGSGSEFYYSNSWWNSRTKLNDNITQANVYSNSTTNFVSEAFFRVPISGAFITCVLDSNYSNSYIEYSGTFNNLNSIGSGGYSSYYSTPANNVGLQVIGRGGELTTTTTTATYGGLVLRGLGVFDGTNNVNTSNYKSSDGNANYRPGNGEYLCFNPAQAVAHSSNSVSNVRLGRVEGGEAYLGGSYSANAYGFGCASDDQDGGIASPGIQISTGRTNARSDAGNSGLYESTYTYESSLELWIIPQNSWTYAKL